MTQSNRKHKNYLVPAVFILTALFCFLGIPEIIAFSTSKDDLVAIAQDSSNNPIQPNSKWAGVYYVKSCEKVKNGVILHLNGASSISFKLSLGYFPDAPPKKNGDWLETEHYDGPWYIMKYYAL